MLGFILEATCRLGLAFEDTLPFKESIGTRVGNGAALILFLSEKEGVERVLIEITKRTAKGSFRDSILLEKLLNL